MSVWGYSVSNVSQNEIFKAILYLLLFQPKFLFFFSFSVTIDTNVDGYNFEFEI